jgi:Mg2+-importing ATPase
MRSNLHAGVPVSDKPRHPAADTSAYWNRSAEVLMRELNVHEGGLTPRQAAGRLRRHGANQLEERDEPGALRLLLRQFASPLVLILVFGAAISLGMREWTEAAIIVAVVVSSAVLATVQEYRASVSMAALRSHLALNAKVWRGGALTTLPASRLVPGDLIELSAGNLVPADGLLLHATDFLVSEASLTGEPFPVEKRPGTAPPDASLAQRRNCVFLGTSVRSGTSRVLVVHTGRATAMGSVAASLHHRQSETAFAIGLRQFGYLLLRVMLFTVVFVLAVNQWLHRPLAESLLFAVALAVGLSPELLPAIVSVTLSHGARAMAARGVIVRRLEAIENLGSMDVLCTDKTGTLTAGVVELSGAVDPSGAASAQVRELAFVNAALETGIENPLDAAIVAACRKAGLAEPRQRKVDEIPYDFIRKRLTIVVEDERDGAGAHRHLMVTKGAFANVLAICASARIGGAEQPLDEALVGRLQAWAERQGTEGFRLMALATRRLPTRADYTHEDERDLCLEGFLLFFDPPKPQAAQTVRELQALGIGIKILSGDNRWVAAHVATAVGLDAGAMLTGEQIGRLNDEALWEQARRIQLFVELDPQQKERIVHALQHGGHAVGYLGDGINDAPALHAADVGISVNDAVDVARESADIVLLQPDLDVLRAGVEEGRGTFANTLKYIRITTSANFGNMMSMAVATPLLPFLPLAAKQILLNNFMSDLPSMSVATDRVDREHIDTAQRWDVHEVRRFMIVFGLISSAFDLLTFAVLLRVFDANEATFRTTWFLVSLLTELAVVLVLRTARPCWRSAPGPLLLGATIAVALLACALPYVSPVASLFDLVPLAWPLMATTLGIVLAYVLCTEAAKYWFHRRWLA